MTTPCHIRLLGSQNYTSTWQAMQTFTQNRHADTIDEIWLLEHPPVFTQGQAGKAEHILNAADIPIVACDRGGQVTYHGPGQLVAYLLVDLRRAHMTIRDFVCAIENAVIDCLKEWDITAQGRRDAPGVYVNDAKIASLGLRVKRGCSYHGLALNVDMDLSPFSRINPCGMKNLSMTQVSEFKPGISVADVGPRWLHYFSQQMRYNLTYDNTSS